MPNNPNLYNAAIAGVAGGNLERWIGADTDYSVFSAVVGNVATAIDAEIAAIEGGGTEQQAALLQAITQGVMAGRSILGLSAANYQEIADAITAVFGELDDSGLTPTGADVWGAQTTWAVDEATGDDSNIGTPASPLASVGELCRRLSNNTIQDNTTIEFVGDVTEPIELRNTKVADGKTVTINGTATTTASGAIGTVTALGPNSGFPWQLDTTGIDWTTVTERRIVITNTASVGAIAWVLEVVDADTVIIGTLSTIGTPSITPTNLMTFDIQELSTVPNSNIDASATAMQLPLVQSIIVQDLRFTSGVNDMRVAGSRHTFFGCDFTFSAAGTFSSDCLAAVFRQCRWNGVAASGHDLISKNIFILIGGILVGGGLRWRTAIAQGQIQQFSTFNAQMFVNSYIRINAGGLHMRDSPSNPFSVLPGCYVSAFSTTSILSGADNLGIGLVVNTGGAYSYQSSAKPTISGATADTQIGGTNTAYASVPSVNATNQAMIVVEA